MSTVQEAVANKLAAKASTVVDILAEKLAAKEIEKRVDIIFQGIILEEKLEKEIKKIAGPDVTTYAEDGTELKATSATRFQERKKKNEVMTKLQELIEKAISGNVEADYENLLNHIKKNDSSGNKEAGDKKSQ